MRTLKKLGLALAVLVALALLLEAAARVRHRVQYGTFRRVYLYERDAATGLMTPVPGHTTDRLRIDSRGFRNPELDVPKPEGRTRIAFLGASTTFCAEATGDEATWPHLLVEALRAARPALDLDYVNAGVGGYTIESSRKNLALRVAPLEPDLIVVYHAVNDISKDTRLLAQEQGVYTEHADSDSWLSRVSLAWFLVEKNLLLRARQKAAVERPANGSAPRLEADPEALAQAFSGRLATLLEECRATGADVVVATFSHQVRAEQDAARRLEACNTALYYMPYLDPDTILTFFDAYNRGVRAAAAATGTPLIEGELDIPGDTAHFNDSVHFKDLGCERMAERMTAGILALDLPSLAAP